MIHADKDAFPKCHLIWQADSPGKLPICKTFGMMHVQLGMKMCTGDQMQD